MTAWTGFPPDPTTDGWHWLRCDPGELGPARWNAATRKWTEGRLFNVTSAMTPHGLANLHRRAPNMPRIEYVGPCVMP